MQCSRRRNIEGKVVEFKEDRKEEENNHEAVQIRSPPG
jgi:hypothetical protein